MGVWVLQRQVTLQNRVGKKTKMHKSQGPEVGVRACLRSLAESQAVYVKGEIPQCLQENFYWETKNRMEAPEVMQGRETRVPTKSGARMSLCTFAIQLRFRKTTHLQFRTMPQTEGHEQRLRTKLKISLKPSQAQQVQQDSLITACQKKEKKERKKPRQPLKENNIPWREEEGGILKVYTPTNNAHKYKKKNGQRVRVRGKSTTLVEMF